MGLNADQFRMLKQLLYALRTAMPCIVQSFDSATQTVTVLPAVMEKMYTNQGGFQAATDIPWDKPFGKIPVVFPKAGGLALTMPVQAGDECLVVFADMCIDQWWQAGGANNVQIEKRRHDLSDGFAIMGVWSQPNLISDYNTSAAELRTLDGSVKLALSDSGVAITGTLSVSGTVVFNGDVDFAG
jgi:hypothetical protein